MLKECKVTLKLDVNIYYDGEFDPEEVKKKLTETLVADHWDCTIEIENVSPEKNYEGGTVRS